MAVPRSSACLFLLAGLVAAQEPPGEPTFFDAIRKVRLETPSDYPIRIRTNDFELKMDGQVCEFIRGRVDAPTVTVWGAVLHHRRERMTLVDYAAMIEKRFKDSKSLDSLELVREQKLDRQPGQWLLRELSIEKFETKFRCIHVCAKDGDDLYTLLLMSETREDDALCRQAMHKIIAKLAVGSGASAGADKPEKSAESSDPQKSKSDK